jgi:hypothetical protein
MSASEVKNWQKFDEIRQKACYSTAKTAPKSHEKERITSKLVI